LRGKKKDDIYLGFLEVAGIRISIGRGRAILSGEKIRGS